MDQRQAKYYRDLIAQNPDKKDLILDGAYALYSSGNKFDTPPDLDTILNYGKQYQADQPFEITKGLKSKTQSMQGFLHGAVGLAGDMVGSDTIRDYGYEGYKRNMAEAQEVAPRVGRVEDINSIGDASDWLMGTIGGLGPDFGEMLATTFIGGMAGSAIPGAGTTAGAIVGATSRKAIREVIEGAIEKQIGKKIASGIEREVAEKVVREEAESLITREIKKAAGKKAGLVLGVAPLEAGGMYGKDADERGIENANPWSAAVLGTASAMTESSGAVGDLATNGLKRPTKSEAVKSYLSDSFGEAGQELVQTGLGDVNRLVNNPDATLSGSDYLNAATAGLVGGFTFGAPSAARGLMSPKAPQDIIKSAKGESAPVETPVVDEQPIETERPPLPGMGVVKSKYIEPLPGMGIFNQESPMASGLQVNPNVAPVESVQPMPVEERPAVNAGLQIAHETEPIQEPDVFNARAEATLDDGIKYTYGENKAGKPSIFAHDQTGKLLDAVTYKNHEIASNEFIKLTEPVQEALPVEQPLVPAMGLQAMPKAEAKKPAVPAKGLSLDQDEFGGMGLPVYESKPMDIPVNPQINMAEELKGEEDGKIHSVSSAGVVDSRERNRESVDGIGENAIGQAEKKPVKEPFKAPEGVKLTSTGGPFKISGAKKAVANHTKRTGEAAEVVDLGGGNYGWKVSDKKENRTLDSVGRVKDGVGIKDDEVFTMASGRKTTPYPKYTNLKSESAKSLKSDQWLIENAVSEAKERGDDFNGNWINRLKPGKLSPSDYDSLNMYLFDGEMDKILSESKQRKILRPLVANETPVEPEKADAPIAETPKKEPLKSTTDAIKTEKPSKNDEKPVLNDVKADSKIEISDEPIKWRLKDSEISNMEDMQERHKSLQRRIDELIDKKPPNNQGAFNKRNDTIRSLKERADALQDRIFKAKKEAKSKADQPSVETVTEPVKAESSQEEKASSLKDQLKAEWAKQAGDRKRKEEMAAAAAKAKDSAAKMMEAFKNINDILGDRGSFSTEKMNENTYQLIKEQLNQAWGHAKDTGKAIAEFVSIAMDALSPKATVYFERWVDEEVKEAYAVDNQEVTNDATNNDGKSEISEDATRDDRDSTSRQSAEDVPTTQEVQGTDGVRVDNGTADGEIKLSKRPDVKTGPTATISELSKPQRAEVEKLQKAGKVNIISNDEAMSMLETGNADIRSGEGGKVQGFVLNGKAYIIQENIQQNNLWNVIRHEIGVHLGQLMQGRPEFNRILKTLENLKNSDTKQGELVRKAFDRVPKDTKPEHIAEEALAYLVESAPEIGIVRRFITMVKRLLVKMGVSPMIFNQADYAALADAAIRKEADRVPGAGETMGPKMSTRSFANKWYSQMTEFVSKKIQGRVSPENAMSMLKSWAQKGEIKQEELEWSGVEEWIKGQSGKISKDEIVEYLNENNVVVDEVEKAPTYGFIATDGSLRKYDTKEDAEKAYEEELEWIEKESVRKNDDESKDPDDIVGAYDSEGNALIEFAYSTDSEEWVEISEYKDDDNLLRFDDFGDVLESIEEEAEKQKKYWRNDSPLYAEEDFTLEESKGSTKYENYQVEGGKNYKELLLIIPEAKDGNYKSPHWDERNVLAHIRFNERTGPSGEKLLFIEEIQSDWHQDGRRKGYKKHDAKQMNFGTWLKENGHNISDGEKERQFKIWQHGGQDIPSLVKNWADEQKEASANNMRIANAPFKKAWPIMSFKRMVRYASENGFDSIAWTPGDVQADRYDLSKQVDSVVYFNNENGTVDIQVAKDGAVIHRENGADKNKTEDLLGKDISTKIFSGEGVEEGDGKMLSGLDLKVGGEGMKGFYDKILPAEVNKFFGKKAWGSPKISTEEIDGIDAHYMPITKEMKDKAIYDGMPLFSKKSVIPKRSEPLYSISDAKDHVTEAMNDALEFSKDLYERKGEILSGAKATYKYRKDKGKNFKEDTTWIEKSFGLVSHYAKKIPAFARTFNAALRNGELKTMIEQSLTHGADGERFIETINNFRRKFKSEYRKLDRYLHDRDLNQVGYRVKTVDPDQIGGLGGKYIIVDLEGKDTRHIFESKKEAFEKITDLEVEDYINDGNSQESARALRLFRTINNRSFDMRIARLEEMEKFCEENGIKLPDEVVVEGEKIKVDLKAALIKMGDRRGYYMPRIRNKGEWVVYASKEGENPRTEYFDMKLRADFRRGQLENNGYRVTVKKAGNLSEDLFEQLGSVLSQQAIINESMEEINKGNKIVTLKDLDIKSWMDGDDLVMSGEFIQEFLPTLDKFEGEKKVKDRYVGNAKVVTIEYRFKNAKKGLEEEISKELFKISGATNMFQEVATRFAKAFVSQYADVIRSRGSRSAMIGRSDKVGQEVNLGFEEDALTRVVRATLSLAGGEAKSRTALSMIETISGRDVSWSKFSEIKRFKGTFEEFEKQVIDNDEQYIDRATFEEIKNNWVGAPQYPDYIEFVEGRGIDPALQKTAHAEAMALFKDMMRNDERADRVIGTLKGLAVLKYLGFRVAAPVVNMTNMVVGVPGAMAGYGKIPIRQAMKHIGKSFAEYRQFKKGELKNNTLKKVFEEIEKRGWDQAQFNHEGMAALQNKMQFGYAKIIETSMMVFTWSEKQNRVATISAAYKGLETSFQDLTFEERLLKAKEISDKAHGIYGKANRPSVVRGGSVGANILQMGYVFKTFTHNFLMTMADLAINERDAKAVAWLLFSPAMFGLGASMGASWITSAIGSALGSDDPDEDLYKWVESTFGSYTENLARFGVFGALGDGISVKGSLNSVGVSDLPTSFKDLIGAPGSVVTDVIEGVGQLGRGNVMKGAESILPLAFGAPVKAYREYTEGITTKSNAPVFFEDKPLKADAIDAFLRALSFNPSRIAGAREKLWGEKVSEQAFMERRKDIYSRVKKYYLDTDRDPEDLQDIEIDIAAFNQRAIGAGHKPIKAKNIKSILKRAKIEE